MKKVLSLVLALAMVLGSFSFVSAAPMSDVAGTVYEEAVERLALLNVLTGYPDGSFKPENTITRAEFAAVAVRSKGLADAANAAKGLATGFTDVTPAHWASGIVGTAAKSGVINGIGNGLFAPEAPVKYEEAVTMLVRALGYEAAAQTKGGYPYGYLIVANEIGLLDEVKGTQGTPASRGIVAQMTDNALEIEMMIQVGFGQDTKWVISGSKEHGDEAEAIYLLDQMGFDSVKGRVISVNTKTDKLVVDPTKEELKNVTLEVSEGFDFYEVEGLETKFWSKDDLVIVYAVQEEAKFDAFKFIDEDEVKLIDEDEEYDIADKKDGFIGITIDDKDEDELVDGATADYAKVVLNDDDEVVWAQAYTFDGFIVVEEVEGNKALSYDDFDEVDLKDFTVVKDGKTIGIDGIEEQDILFYNSDEEFAVVYNNGTEGELDRVYANNGGFRFEGSGYTLTEIADSLYFDNGKVGELTDEILDDLLDEEATITVYVDFAGKAVVVAGEVSSVGNSAYGVLIEDTQEFTGRKGEMVALDIRNGENAKVSYDIAENDIPKNIKLDGKITTIAHLRGLVEGEVVKISVDKDGDITKIEQPEFFTGADKFKISDSSVKVGGVSYKLQASTIIFHDGNDEATTLGNAKGEFEEVIAGSTIYVEKGRVVAVVGATDADTDTKNITGLVTKVKELPNGKFEFTVEVFGEVQRLLTKSKTHNSSEFAGFEDSIRTFKVGETSLEIESFPAPKEDSFTILSRSGKTITPEEAGKNVVELNNKVKIYDANDDFEELSVNDLKAGVKVTVYYQGTSSRFIDYVVVGSTVTDPVTVKGVVTYINTTNHMTLAIGSETYYADAKTIVKDKNGVVKGMGSFNPIAAGDQVEIKDNVATIKATATELATAELTRVQAKAAARFAQLPGATLTVADDTDLATAKAAVAAVTAPALTTAELALLDGTTTPTNAAYTTAEGYLTATKANIAAYEAVAEFKRLVALIPSPATLADRTKVEAARTEYGKLTSGLIASVATEYGLLTTAEGEIAALDAATTEVNKALAAISLVVTNDDAATVTLTATQGGTHATVGAPVMTIETSPIPTGVSLTSPAVDITRQAEEVKVTVKVELTHNTALSVKASKTFEITVPVNLVAPIVK